MQVNGELLVESSNTLFPLLGLSGELTTFVLSSFVLIAVVVGAFVVVYYGTKLQKMAYEKDSKAHLFLGGGGLSALLEFSTILLIIGSIIILGIHGILEGREIATILAAIAGYILGKGRRTEFPSQKEKRNE